MTVTLSAVSDNTATSRGGGLAAEGGLFAANTVELANATVSGNTAGLAGGGLYVAGAGIAPDIATLKLSNVTVAGNGNGGIQLTHDRSDPVLEAGNAIVGAQLSGADCALDGAAVITSSGGNLESGTSCAFTAGSDQQSVADLGLGPIADNGGRTLTHDLLPGSPAIDAGRQRTCTRDANGKDQRGLARFYDGDGDGDFACDSGAVEVQGLLANPGFEEPLDPAADWSLTASGGGDGRAADAATPNGRFVLLLAANGALETVSQAVPLAGDAGESYALSLRALGTGLTPGEGADLTLRSTQSGTPVDSVDLPVHVPRGGLLRRGGLRDHHHRPLRCPRGDPRLGRSDGGHAGDRRGLARPALSGAPLTRRGRRGCGPRSGCPCGSSGARTSRSGCGCGRRRGRSRPSPRRRRACSGSASPPGSSRRRRRRLRPCPIRR